jgi:serine/threonine protein kinase
MTGPSLESQSRSGAYKKNQDIHFVYVFSLGTSIQGINGKVFGVNLLKVTIPMAFLLKDYTDIKEIARGGMGKVYLATQISLNRKVIIKEMASGLLKSQIEIKRFENEARAAAALNHDNIIRIYDFGEDRESFYIAMEFIDGPALETILKDRNYIPEIGLMIALYALKGLVHAHSHHIIHRDIKPGNILISKAGAVKVVDFGLAHANSQQKHLTASDVIVGTPLFMSPEQATGEEKKDQRMDVWSVGVLLYRIISGVFPFQGENVPAILFQIVQTKEPPIQDHFPALPPDLAEKINNCLIKDRAKRLSNLSLLIESLQNYFYEIGIKDTAEQIRQYVSDPSSSARALSRQLFEYHQRKAEAFLAEGNEERAHAHAQQAKRYDPLFKPITRAIDAIKKHTSSSIILKSTQVGNTSGIGAWQQPSPGKRFSIVALISTIMALLVLAAGAVFFFHLLNKSDPRDRSVRNILSAQNRSADSVMSSAPVKGGTVRKADTVAPGFSSAHSIDTTPAPDQAEKLATKKTSIKPGVRVHPDASLSGILKIFITPSNAEVRVDGEKISALEMVEGRRLITGLHQIDAAAKGFEPVSKSVTVEKEAVQIITIDLTTEIPGMSSVHVHSYPWAEIFIDGEFKGNSPTAKPIALTEGTHTIVLQRAGFKTHKETVAIKKGELKRIKVILTKG